MKKVFSLILALVMLACCSLAAAEGIDYMALVNKLHPLPDGWEASLETVTITNSLGDEVEVEAKAYAAYELLKADLQENDSIYIELDSARRSVAEQQRIMKDFTEKYGLDYALKTVAPPGYSEHHTGLALDLYFRVKDEETGEMKDVYKNEVMEKEEYLPVWDTIHSKLAKYGFILRYLQDKEYITGYRYEPWHIRYVDDPVVAEYIMVEGITLEENEMGMKLPEVGILGTSSSEIFGQNDLNGAVSKIMCEFASFDRCILEEIRYAGDEYDNGERIDWANSMIEDPRYMDVALFLVTFRDMSVYDNGDPYRDEFIYDWWMGRLSSGDWETIDYGEEY